MLPLDSAAQRGDGKIPRGGGDGRRRVETLGMFNNNKARDNQACQMGVKFESYWEEGVGGHKAETHLCLGVVVC